MSRRTIRGVFGLTVLVAIGAVALNACTAAGESMPASYLVPATEAGSLETLDYSTTFESERIRKSAVVYLPSGYDEGDDRFDILYLMHGAGMNAESFLGSPDQPTPLKNEVDHLIQDGLIRPLIIVSPTFYPDGNPGFDLHRDGQLDRAFPRELAQNLMPAAEGRFRTFATTPDRAGFAASRDHRAFGGFSMGAVTTWFVFGDLLDDFSVFLPMSGDSWVVADAGGSVATEETAERLADSARQAARSGNNFTIINSIGSNDGLFGRVRPQIDAMRTHSDAFDRNNLRFDVDSGGGHDFESVQRQFFRSAQQVF